MGNIIAVKQDYDQQILDCVSMAVANGISSALSGKYQSLLNKETNSLKPARVAKEDRESTLSSLKAQFS
jgi:hypothetical protein